MQGSDVLGVVINILSEKFPSAEVESTTDILAVGLADSLAFAEIILTVEELTTMSFNHESLDFDGPITPQTMARAFQSPQKAA